MIPVLAAMGVLAAPPAKRPAATAPKLEPAAAANAPASTVAPKPARPAPAWSVAFSPDGKSVAVGGYKRVTLYDATTGKRTAQWVVSPDAVRTLAYSPDGKMLAAGGGSPAQSGTATLVDAATGKPVRALKHHTDTVEALAFSGNFLLTAADDESVRIADVSTGKTVATLSEHVGRCLSVAVPAKTEEAAGGAIFATGGADNMVKVWDAGMRRVVVNFDQAQSPVWSLAALNSPGRFVAACGDGSVRLFSVRKANEAPSPGEPQPRNGSQDRVMGNAHPGGVYSIAVAPDDAFLVTGGADGSAALWDLNGGRKKSMADAKGAVWGVAVSPDGKKVAAASEDGTARVYDSESGKLLLELPERAPEQMPSTPHLGPVNTGTGLRASYFANRDLAGKPALTRVDATVDFTWNDVPAPGLPADEFSVRWEGYVEAPADGVYTISTRSDDGVRLWVGGQKVVDAWTDRGPTDDAPSKTFSLKAGQRVAVKLEYYEFNGGAEARLFWEYPGQAKQPIPTTRLYPTGAAPAVAPKAPVKPKAAPASPPAAMPGRIAKG